MPGRGPFRLLTAATLCLAALCGCSAPSSGSGHDPAASLVEGEAASATSPFWVDPESQAARQVRKWKTKGRSADAEALKRIAERPVAAWPPGDDPAPVIERAVRSATEARRTVVLVAYNIPHRDCGLYSAGGAADAQEYGRWMDAFAGAIGDARAVVILEPDAVPHVADGCTPAEHHTERFGLLSRAVTRLKRQPHTKVYLDAGNPAWISDPGKLTDPLRRAGIGQTDGFSLNVSNFQSNKVVKAFGTRLSGLLDGAHFVVDTSRNGAGPLPRSRDQAWCNPPGRALGTPPTTRTGSALLDAYLWIKRPGESDGPCRGGPAAGTWWPDYALGLARRVRD